MNVLFLADLQVSPQTTEQLNLKTIITPWSSLETVSGFCWDTWGCQEKGKGPDPQTLLEDYGCTSNHCPHGNVSVCEVHSHGWEHDWVTPAATSTITLCFIIPACWLDLLTHRVTIMWCCTRVNCPLPPQRHTFSDGRAFCLYKTVDTATIGDTKDLEWCQLKMQVNTENSLYLLIVKLILLRKKKKPPKMVFFPTLIYKWCAKRVSDQVSFKGRKFYYYYF